MSAAPEVINPRNVAEITQCWNNSVHLVRMESGKGSLAAKLLSGDASSSSDELNTKVRKPYTITKQRERWTESEHQKFLEALKLYGRAWRRIEEYVGSKTAVQIRSHAQKFFSKLEREASSGSSGGMLANIAIPPPRPKRKPNHPYPKKAGNGTPTLDDEGKEISSPSSPAGTESAHLEDFQAGTSTNSTSQGLGSDVQFPLVCGPSVGSQGSVKIFGKTVVVPGVDQPGFHNELSKGFSVSKHGMAPSRQSLAVDLKQTVGFSPFVKLRENVNSSPDAQLALGGSGCLSRALQCEGTGESLGRPLCIGSRTGDTKAAGYVPSNNEDCKARVESGAAKAECGSSTVDLKAGEKTDAPQVMHPVLQTWMDNFLKYHQKASSTSLLPANGAVEIPNDFLSYWQFMQTSAVNYAAYTAAMAAAAAASAGWKASKTGGSPVLNETPNGSSNEPLVQPVPAWWSYRGLLPSVYFPPAGVLHQGDYLDTCRYGEELVKKEVEALPPQGYRSNLRVVEQAELSDPDFGMDDGGDYNSRGHTRILSSTPHHRRLETSCISESSGYAKASPDSESQHEREAMEATELGSGTCTRGNKCSSSDEFENLEKKLGVHSSSGSNTLASRCQSSDCDVQMVPESEKRDSYTLSKVNDDCAGEAWLNCHHHCNDNLVDMPKLRVKHSEKARKLPQRDSRHGGGSEDTKRLKSCAPELELRKEVSEEGRKAFQALFTSKSLPQTFPTTSFSEVGETLVEHEFASKPGVSKHELRMNESIIFSGLSKRKVHGEGDSNRDVTMADTAIGLHGQPLANSKLFTISSSSGFVPYKRPISPEPVRVDADPSF